MDTINVAILGPVSAGKSTFMNSMFVKQFSDMKIKRTTMTPQVYLETLNLDLTDDRIKEIKRQNKEINDELIRKTESGETITYDEISQSIEYQVPRVYNLHELPDDIYLKVYDIPGLNDARTAELYFQYLDNHFHEWDIIIMVVDINSAMNTDGEVRILNKIVDNCKLNLDKYSIKNKLFILANKVDDLEHCPEWGLRIGDEEYVEMYEQIKKQVKDVINSKYPELEYFVMPISAEDAFIYRMYGVDQDVEMDMKHINKFGHNEFGKSRWNRFSLEEKTTKIKEIMKRLNIQENLELTGFNYFQKQFNNILNPNSQYTFLINHLMFKCSQLLEEYKSDSSTCYYNKYLEVYNNILDINKKYLLDIGLNKFYKYLSEFVELHKVVHLGTKEQLENTKEEHIEHLEWAQLHCNKWKHKFGIEFKLLEEQENIITNCLNNYYANNIEEQKKPVSILLSRFKKLFANGYNITKELIIKLFTNNDMLNNKPNEIIEIIEDMIEKKLITKEQQTDMIYNLLCKIYENINKNKQIEYVKKENIPEYCYFVDLFWQRNNYIINESKPQEYYKLGFYAKQNVYLKINANTNANTNTRTSTNTNTNTKKSFTYYDIFNPKVSLEAYYVSLF